MNDEKDKKLLLATFCKKEVCQNLSLFSTNHRRPKKFFFHEIDLYSWISQKFRVYYKNKSISLREVDYFPCNAWTYFGGGN